MAFCLEKIIAPGVTIAQKIGLDVLRAKYGHFNNWIEKLEGLK
jgi:hypothetical protein